MVALVVGGMALLLAAALLATLGNRAEAIERAATKQNEDANAERLLQGLVANLDPGSDTTPSFVGDGQSVTFRTWCDTPAGWLDRCSAHLWFERRQDVTALRLLLHGSDSSEFELRRGLETGRLRYLVNARDRGTWAETWTERVPRVAVAIITDGDTLLLARWGS